MADRFSLKDELINADTVAHLGSLFSAHIDAGRFQDDVMARLPELELKERINWIATSLDAQLPDAFVDKAGVIETCLPPPLDPGLRDDDFGHFIYAPLGVIVERGGIDAHLERSLDLLEQITQRFSMEFSIRAFLNRWPEETLERMQVWTTHPNYHVRRLASEGGRPKLPWGQGIAVDPKRMLPLLDALHCDNTRFVTRSVSNHLNDISKFDPDIVIERLRGWAELGQQDSKEFGWMTRHALRGLIKQGHPGAMELLGFRTDPKVTLERLEMPKSVAIGGKARIEVVLAAAQEEPLIVDYAIDFLKANGSHSAKVFKLKTVTVKPEKPVTLQKDHLFKGGATTFTLRPGPQKLRLLVNGTCLGVVDFELT